jgi:hypothetical protein
MIKIRHDFALDIAYSIFQEAVMDNRHITVGDKAYCRPCAEKAGVT